METLLHDIRYAARKLLRSPGFTAIAVLTLALGVGAATAVCSIVDTVLIRPLPFKNPEQLVVIQSTGHDGSKETASPLDLIDYDGQNHTLTSLQTMKSPRSMSLRRDDGTTIRLFAAPVSAGFFSLLGVPARIGRTFAPGEDASGAPHVVVLSYPTWQNQFGGDRRIVGRTIGLADTSYVVVGVAPPGLTYPESPDLWVAYQFEKWEIAPDNRGVHELVALGRLKPGLSVTAARRDLQSIANRLAAQYPKSNTGVGAAVEPLKSDLVGSAKPALLAVFGAVILVLLIACANVANLLLMRATARQTEIAVRTALGASRARIARQLVTEYGLLSLAAALLGTVFAAWAVEAVRAYGRARCRASTSSP